MGEIDDSADKLRRNAMMTSFALIVTSFLGVKINSQDITLFGSKIHSEVPAWKFWLLLFCVQFYCFARHWTDRVNQSYVRDFWDKYTNAYVNSLESMLCIQFYIDLQRAESRLFNLDDINTIRNQANYHGVESATDRVSFSKYEFNNEDAKISQSGRLSNFVVLAANSQSKNFLLTSTVGFKLPTSRFLLLHLKAMSNAARPDSVVLDISPPFFLGLIAYSIALLHLMKNIIHPL